MVLPTTSATSSTNPEQANKMDNVLKVSKRVNIKKKPTDYKKVFGHYVYNTHYVLYVMECYNGKTIAGTEYEFKDHKKLISIYKTKLTNQQEVPEDAIVESILTHRMVNGRPLYLVQWEGYPSPIWNSEVWEDKLQNCKELLDEYKAMINKNPSL